MTVSSLYLVILLAPQPMTSLRGSFQRLSVQLTPRSRAWTIFLLTNSWAFPDRIPISGFRRKNVLPGGTLQKDATDIPVILVRFSALWSGIVCHIRNGLAASVLTLGLQDHEH